MSGPVPIALSRSSSRPARRRSRPPAQEYARDRTASPVPRVRRDREEVHLAVAVEVGRRQARLARGMSVRIGWRTCRRRGRPGGTPPSPRTMTMVGDAVAGEVVVRLPSGRHRRTGVGAVEVNCRPGEAEQRGGLPGLRGWADASRLEASPVAGDWRWPRPGARADRRLCSQLWNDMVSSPFRGWSAIEWGTSFPAQTERRGGAGPVRGLLGGKASPAALLVSLFAGAPLAVQAELPALLPSSLNSYPKSRTRHRHSWKRGWRR